MKRKTINEHWTLSFTRPGPFMPAGEKLVVNLPATVYSALLEQGKMPDPYYGENELAALSVMDNDFVFETEFDLESGMLSADALSLVFYGIDTLADIFLNGIAIGTTDNMHRTWRFDISSVASQENTLRVVIHSPTAYIAEENRKIYTGGASEAMEGFPHLRKAHCMFGWDWGARLPDAGIFRPVEIIAHKKADLHEVSVYQEHIKTGRGVHGYIIPEVILHITAEVNVYEAGCPVMPGDAEELAAAGLRISVEAESPDGAVYHVQEERRGRILDDEGETGIRKTIRIPDPQLWWPSGYGAQPLYTLRVCLIDEESGETLDQSVQRIGLRILTVNQDPMSDGGRNFAFKINGLPIFARGANMVPEDNLLSRITRERSEKLLREAVWANYNMIRIWGGGYYPSDDFYDLCDELGLIVWQDFMFACASYELDDAFEETILSEIRDNVRRLRHHACLGLWCGNNEVETQTLDRAWKPSMKQKSDYIKIFEYLIPKLLSSEDPDTSYWPSSPSAGGNFDNPWAENIGDTHYWEVWHGNVPFTEFRKHAFRFVSEFGFQSFPCLATIRRFAEPQDQNIFSRVMEMHQRNTAANGKLMFYLSANYLYPKNFEMVLYATQLLQAQAIRYAIEHFRRNRGTTMGALVWQMNDISPMASWSGIDYYGNRKALHYMERRVFAPVLISCEEHGEIDQKPWVNTQPKEISYTALLHVANETHRPFDGVVRWALRDSASVEIASGREQVQVLPYDGRALEQIDAQMEAGEAFDPREIHLEYTLESDGSVVSGGMALFCAPKHYRFMDPKLSVTQEGDEVIVRSKTFASGVCILDGDCPAVCEDNFFDMEAGERRIRLEKQPEAQLSAVSVYEIAG
ncbi:MAG: glycoside hydrolase family 2 protein [Lachnospiraceae bacterium]|nr:glycoside hydrolase family 2 protein [Lachnospiraceae bacterium]